jgi:hypothetical protein
LSGLAASVEERGVEEDRQRRGQQTDQERLRHRRSDRPPSEEFVTGARIWFKPIITDTYLMPRENKSI